MIKITKGREAREGTVLRKSNFPNLSPKNKIACKLFIYRRLTLSFVVWGGIKPPTQGFSVLYRLYIVFVDCMSEH